MEKISFVGPVFCLLPDSSPGQPLRSRFRLLGVIRLDDDDFEHF